MSVFSNFVGTMKDFFHIGGTSGSGIKNSSGTLEARNSSDTDYVNINVKAADGTVLEHATNWKNNRDTHPLIGFSFDGGAAPAAGSNTGKYGFCHTSGGSYSAGQIYYDDGSDLVAIKIFVGMRLFTTSAVSGSISLIANGIYSAESASAPYSWTLKGGAADVGTEKVIGINIGTNSSYSSTTNIPADALVMNIFADIATAYSSGTTIAVVLDGSTDVTLQDTDANDPETIGSYYSQSGVNVDSNTEGPIRIDISGSPTSGEGTVYVEYTAAVQA